tara:strand:+ start:1364 stop:1951 length:588 start_codon:yes stop_codon:yes gene_type:complete
MPMTIETLTERLEIIEKTLATLMADNTKQNKKDSSDDSSVVKAKRTSGYLLYSSEFRDTTKQKLLEDSGDSPKPTDVTKALASQWKELSDEERQKWNDKAKETSSSNVSPPKEKKPPKSKKAKDDSSPKKPRPKSGYNLFQKGMRDDAVCILNETNDGDIKQTMIMTQIAKMWKELSDEDKAVWNDKAKEYVESD